MKRRFSILMDFSSLYTEATECPVRLFRAKRMIKQFSLSHFEHEEYLSNVYTDSMDPRKSLHQMDDESVRGSISHVVYSGV